MERIWADVKQTICGICSASCPAQVYVRNGEIVRVEASRQPGGSGYLCAKGHAGRGYLYRADRVQTPLRRVGERGEGLFAPITWDEAYREIAERLLPLKAESGPESVAFYSGYSKWYRPLLHRLAHSFGSLNYGTESSSCFQSSMMAHLINAGVYCRPDPQNAELLIVWGGNPFHSTNFSGFALDDLKEKGLEVLYIDPRVTPYSRYADLQLRPRAGTDGALAHFFAQSLIAAGRADLPYIEKYVHGYPPYEAYVRDFSLERAADLTGIAPRDLQAAADMLIRRRRFTIAASQTALTHHANGMQGYRAVMALSAITGNFDREGGMVPLEHSRQSLNHPRLLTEEFIQETRPQNAKAKIGTERFPLWSELIDEFQAMDLGRQILEGTPYPVRAVVAFGLNVRMFPGNRRLVEALKALDFLVDTDIFLTDSAKLADIVLPACTPYERAELIGGPAVRYVQPAIPPRFSSRSDADIICQMAQALDLDDARLRGGYEACCRYLLREVGLTLSDLQLSPLPRKIPGREPYLPGTNLLHGLDTPTGKFELYSERIARHVDRCSYNPLPVHEPAPDAEADAEYPFLLTAGSRIPWAFHSRFHDVPWARALRPTAAADLNPADARARSLRQGDEIVLATPEGEIVLQANLTHMTPPGAVFVYHGYAEADVNSLLHDGQLDRYSGFPTYRSVRCAIRKKG